MLFKVLFTIGMLIWIWKDYIQPLLMVQNQRQTPPPQSGENRYKNAQAKPNKRFDEADGDYIDYEEIKP